MKKHSKLFLLSGAAFIAVAVIFNIMTISTFEKHTHGGAAERQPSMLSIALAKQNFTVEKQAGSSSVMKKKHDRLSADFGPAANEKDKETAEKTTTIDAIGEANPAVKENKNETTEKIRLVLPPKEIEWIRNRVDLYHNVYNTKRELNARKKRIEKAATDPERFYYNETTGFTKYQEDKEGPWLDFMIAGHPKTGTTTLVANLANVAPMKVKDFCVATMDGVLRFVYKRWLDKFPEIQDLPDKYIPDRNLQMRGAKCPRYLSDPLLLLGYGYAYPRTKLIIGIRHPVLWFTSFFNMGNVGDLYTRMKLCPHYSNIDPFTGIPKSPVSTAIDKDGKQIPPELCIGECRCGIPVCFHRSRLHLPLARVGKTPLSTKEERDLLAPGDPDGGENLFNGKLRNPVFVYDQTQMKDGSYWDELAQFLGLSYIPNAHYHAAHGQGHNKTLCVDYLDEFRSKMMAHSYNMSVWLENYFLPVGLDPNRPDVVIANPESFRAVLQTYKEDPCRRLVRRESDGEYILDPSLGEGTLAVYSTKREDCPASYPKSQAEKDMHQQRKKAARLRRGMEENGLVPRQGKRKKNRGQLVT